MLYVQPPSSARKTQIPFSLFIYTTLSLFLSPNQYSAEHLNHLNCFTNYFCWLKPVQHLFSVTAQYSWFIFNLSSAVCSRACSIWLCLSTQYSLINSHSQTSYFSLLQESLHISLCRIFFYRLLLIFLCEISCCISYKLGSCKFKIQFLLTGLNIPASCPASFILTKPHIASIVILKTAERFQNANLFCFQNRYTKLCTHTSHP